MGMDMYLYELIEHEERKPNTIKSFELKEVLYLSRGTASIFANWLYKNHFEKVDDYKEGYGYIKIYSDDIDTFLDGVTKVLNASGLKRDVYALFYTPPLDNVDCYISNPVMFDEDYYNCLDYLKVHLSKLIYDENGDMIFKTFFYNISG